MPDTTSTSKKTEAGKLTAEFIGTAFLLAVVVGSGIMGERLSPDNSAVALLANSLATGAGLYVLINVFGPVSGAHFNPAVSLCFRLLGELSTGQMLRYMLVQILGGALGVMAANLMFELPAVNLSTTERFSANLWLSEAIATAGLLGVILLAVKHRAETVATSVALYITAAYWFTSSTSFANPAVTLARTLSDTFAGIAPHCAPVFIAVQLATAVLVALLWKRAN